MENNKYFKNNVENHMIENYLAYSPQNMDTMSLEEKVDFLMKERLILGNMISYIIHNVKELHNGNNIFECIPERLKIASYYKQQYKYPDIQKRYTDAHEKAILQEREFRQAIHEAQDEFRQHISDLLGNRVSKQEHCS